ncbi:TauD/TfdA family dioxygenase [Roseomonas sp. NAR14]|uniref:TauD/TfdA family dioxygenase n=1 Tax=Roseomonas acroporae TaxID=2937791 RepID=A0A9X1Y689_9PROT|nr:TauD/TfdA family dioxygenase [Roseomonas acroporae]MCK8783005.1 TauD/TfdA family dioxygenase [Roseomonas acroporae]
MFAPRPRLTPQIGPHVWQADTLSPADWMIPVGQEDAAELAATVAALDGHRPAARGEVPLPRLAPTLAALAERLETGHGFALLRGFPVDRAQPEHAELALLILALQLGAVLPQEGAPVGRLAAAGADRGGSGGRFHADPCDVVGLLCLRQPPAGSSTLVAAGAAHNALMRLDRAALETLYQPLPQRLGGMVMRRAVFGAAGGAFVGRYERDAIEDAVAEHPLTPAQRAALDRLDAACEEPALPLTLETRAGDVLFYNPHLVWKRQAADGPEAGAALPREMLRLCLAAPSPRRLPVEAPEAPPGA